MLDLRGAWNPVGGDDFQFDIGPGAGAAPAWSPAPAPRLVTVRTGAGAGGSDRITFVWPDRAIRNAWLRVTVKSNADTGLAQSDVFYFGNLIGETGLGAGDDDTALTVNALDLVSTRRHRAPGLAAPVTSPFDFNRDGRVNALDMAAARATPSRSLALLAPPALARVFSATALVREE